MTAGVPTSTGGSSPWETFSQKHPANPHLDLDPLYALPQQLIDSLSRRDFGATRARRQGVFLTRDEAGFETDLAHHGGSGFDQRRPFHYPLLVGPEDPNGRLAEANEAIHEMVVEDLSTSLNPMQVSKHLRNQEERNQAIDEHRISYAGWLVSNPTFRRELTALRGAHEARVQQFGFPELPQTDLLKRPHWDGSPPGDAILGFYRRWGLHRLVTWDLPLPMWAAITRGSLLYDDFTMEQSGLLLFIPWHLLRNTDITLQDLTDYTMKERGLKHLDDWPARKARSGKRIGPGQHRHLLILYCYRELALASRYGDRMKKHVRNLDRAFGELLGVGDDMVKKLRLEMPRGPASSTQP